MEMPGGLIVTSLRLPFVIKRKSGEEGEDGEVVREESRDEWARSVAHLVRETGGQWVGWAGPALSSGDSLPPPAGGVEAGLEAGQVIPVFLSQAEVEAHYRRPEDPDGGRGREGGEHSVGAGLPPDGGA